MKKALILTAPVVWAVIVFVLHVVHLRSESETTFIPHADKIIHFSMFGILSFLLVSCWVKSPQTNLRLLLIFILTAAYGGLLEWIQGLDFVQRDPDWLDWLADLTGAFSGILLALKRSSGFLFGHKVRKTT